MKDVPESVNKTHLDIEKANERGLVHRDYLAHALRWNYTLRHAKMGMNILDAGCGNGMLAQVMYVNRYKPALYVGIDIRNTMIEILFNRKLNFPATGLVLDLRKNLLPYPDDFFDLVTCYELIEHFHPSYLDFFLAEVRRVLKPEGKLLLSTPNYDGVHKAGNHVHEFREGELEGFLSQRFKILKKHGTFASQREIYPHLTGSEKTVFDSLKPWFDSNILSVIFASLHPSQSRNILWVCQKTDKRDVVKRLN